MELEEILAKEEISWMPKMKFQWAKDRDANSRLFHRVASRRCRKSLIKELELEDGDISRDFDVMRSLVFMLNCLRKICLVDLL